MIDHRESRMGTTVQTASPCQLAEISNVVILNVANGTQSLLQKDALKGVADNQVSEHCNFNMIEAEKHVE